MADCEINVTVEDAVSIEVTLQDQVDIDVTLEGGVTPARVACGTPIYLDYPTNQKYFVCNPSTNRVEGWRDGVKRFEF